MAVGRGERQRWVKSQIRARLADADKPALVARMAVARNLLARLNAVDRRRVREITPGSAQSPSLHLR